MLDKITSSCDKIKVQKPVYYSYIRFSTPDQINGDSLRRQLDGARAYVERQGGILDETKTYKDLGIPSFRGQNTRKGSQLGAFLEQIESGQIKRGSFLIVEAIDRISRNEPVEQLNLILKIIRAGISIVTLFDGRVYSQETLNKDLSAAMYLQALICRGHEESLTKSTRVSAIWTKARSMGMPITCKCPAWLRGSRENQKITFQKIEERCKIVERIFRLSAQGKGKIAIAKLLNQDNVPSWGTGKRENKGKTTGWYPSYVRKILCSRAVLGEFQPHRLNNEVREKAGPPIPNYYPRVISDDLYFTVHGQRKKNSAMAGRRSLNVHNLFSNVAHCAYCGAPLHFKNHGQWQYLVCSRGKRGMECSSTGWPYKDFEASFLSFIRGLDMENVVSGNKTEKIIRLEDTLALNEGLLLDSCERREKLKSLLIENPTQSAVIALTELDNEVTRHEFNVNRISGELAKARQTQTHLNTTDLTKQVENPEFRSKLQCEIRRCVKRIDVFAKGFAWTPQIIERIRNNGNADEIASRYATNPFEVFRICNKNQRISHRRKAEDLPLIHPVRLPDKQDRFFVVYFEGGEYRVVKPNFNNPKEFSILAEMGGSSQEFVVWNDLTFSL